MVVAQQNRVTPSPFNFGLFGLWTSTWTWIVTKFTFCCRKSGSCSSFQYDYDSQTCSLGGEVNYDFVTQFEEGKQPIFTKIPGSLNNKLKFITT